MKPGYSSYCWLLALLLSACSDSPFSTELDPASRVVGLASVMPAEVPERPRTGPESYWANLTDEQMWAKLVSADSSAWVGVKVEGHPRGVWRAQILVPSSYKKWSVTSLGAHRGIEVIDVDSLLPVVKVRIGSQEALASIRRLGFVDYLEPNVTDIRYLSSGSSGCAYETWTGGVGLNTFAGDYLPPHYTHPAADIDLAWNRARGDGVVIGLADTGISADQWHLNGGFTSGNSSGRWSSYHGIQARPWYETDCSHGNRMAGAMVGPMNGFGSVGVAWRANLVSAHQSGGVFTVDADDARDGIRVSASALSTTAPNRRIVTMAFQADNWLSMVSDEIRYWHARGRLFIGASGSVDYAGIAFPADMQEVMAVSVVGDYFEELSGWNYGDQVEVSFFATQLTNGKSTPELSNLNGTSGGAAIISGIAALTWSRYPQETNEQIRDRIRRAGHQYPSRDRVRGYGVVDAMRAVGGLWTVNIVQNLVSGGNFNETAIYDLEAVPVGGDGPYTYQWNTGETTKVIRVHSAPNDPDQTFTVTVNDPDPYGLTINQGSTTVSPPPGGCSDPSQIIC